MKKTLFTLFTVINLVLLYCPAALALTEDEAAAAVDAQGKDAVSGNLFLWLLCDCLSESCHEVGRHPALFRYRRFSLTWLDAV